MSLLSLHKLCCMPLFCCSAAHLIGEVSAHKHKGNVQCAALEEKLREQNKQARDVTAAAAAAALVWLLVQNMSRC
jgi:hypothetical protein